ncbi:MAG: DUF3592 domain-containing protein [Bdellovibrionota bacterium]|jgi:hypothetical protein
MGVHNYKVHKVTAFLITQLFILPLLLLFMLNPDILPFLLQNNLYQVVSRGVHAQKYSHVEGHVLSSNIRQEFGSSPCGDTFHLYRPVIIYEYTINGVTRSDNFIPSKETVSQKAAAEEFIAKYPQGSAVDVLYNPLDHSDSILKSEILDGLNLPIAVVVTLFGLILLILEIVLIKGVFFKKGVIDTEGKPDLGYHLKTYADFRDQASCNYSSATTEDPFKDYILNDEMSDKPDEYCDENISQITDPFCKRIDWTPATGFSSTFKTHNLIRKDDYLLQYKPTNFCKIFFLIFGILGITLFFIGMNTSEFLMAAAGILFFIILPFIVAVSHGLTRVKNFDKRLGYYWEGSKPPNNVTNPKSKNLFALQTIKAIQITSHAVRSSDSPNDVFYFCHEINLVLNDTSRFNVISYGGKEQILEDGKTISQFLRVPLWYRFTEKHSLS